MHVDVVRYRFTRPLPVRLDPAQPSRIEQELVPLLETSSGFRGFYLVRAGDHELAIVTIWDTAGDADSAWGMTRQWMVGAFGGVLAGDPRRVNGDVLLHHR